MPVHASPSPLQRGASTTPPQAASARSGDTPARTTFATLGHAAEMGHRFDRIDVGEPARSAPIPSSPFGTAVIQCFRNRITRSDEHIMDVPSSHLEDHATNPDHALSAHERAEVNAEMERRANMNIHVPSREEERRRAAESDAIDLTLAHGIPSLPRFPPPSHSLPTPSYSSAPRLQPPYQPFQPLQGYPPPFGASPLPFGMQPMPPSTPHLQPTPPNPVEAYKQAYGKARFVHSTRSDNVPGIMGEGLQPRYAATDKGMTYLRNPQDAEMMDNARKTGIHLQPRGAGDASYGGYLESKGVKASTLRVFLDREQLRRTGRDPEDVTATGYRDPIAPTAIKPVKPSERPLRPPEARAQARLERLRIIGSHLEQPVDDATLSALHQRAVDEGQISDDDE